MQLVVAPYDPVWMIMSHPNGLNWLLYEYQLIKVTRLLNMWKACFQVVGTLLWYTHNHLY